MRHTAVNERGLEVRYLCETDKEEKRFYWRKIESSFQRHNYLSCKLLGKRCVRNEYIHLENYKGNYVIRGNPAFSWDEAETKVFEKNFSSFLAAEQAFQRT